MVDKQLLILSTIFVRTLILAKEERQKYTIHRSPWTKTRKRIKAVAVTDEALERYPFHGEVNSLCENNGYILPL